MTNDFDPALMESVKKALRQHIKVDATGLSPAVASAFIVGFYDAALAVLAALRESGRLVEWRPIAEANTDGTVYLVWVEGREGLPPFVTHCAYHHDAGWCADELREVTHFLASMAPPATAATEGE